MVARRKLSSLLVVLVVGAGSLLSVPAAGDWLVTQEGAKLETRGTWEIKGSLVLFHTPDGVLSSLRRDAIDLDRSAAWTERMKRSEEARKVAPPVEAVPRRKATFILTDADVGHVDEVVQTTSATESVPGADQGQIEGREAAKATAGKPSDVVAVQGEENPLQVASWKAVLGAGAEGITISGVVKNPSEYLASGIVLEVTVLSLAGEELGSKSASVDPKALSPGESGSFRVLFSGVFSVGNALFEVTSFNAVINESPEE